jgi:mono/diheme cytochrome c family protein
MKTLKTRKNWLAPAIFAALVISLSVTLVTIGARSPYTHNNLAAGVVSGYNRTNQTLVGPPQPRQVGPRDRMNGDLAQQGAALFMNLECASCHGLRGEGGVYAPIIAGVNAAEIQKKTSAGPGGMNKFEGLSENDLAGLEAFLQSVTKAPGSK